MASVLNPASVNECLLPCGARFTPYDLSMADAENRVAELERAAAQVRVRSLEFNRGLVEELTGIWNELNTHATDNPEVRDICDIVAGDIAQLEKLDLAFDTEWLAQSKRDHAAAADHPTT